MLIWNHTTSCPSGVGECRLCAPQGANKMQVKEAVEKAWNVNVLAVNVISVPSKTRRVGKHQVATQPWRKAVVTIRSNQKIEIFEGV